MFRRTICALTAWAALAGRAPAESPEADPPKGKTATAAEPAPPDRKPARPAERPGTAAPAARLGSLSPGVVPTGYRQAKAEPPPSDAPPKSTQLPDPRPVPQPAPPSGPAYVPAPPPDLAYPAGPACAGCAQYGGHAGDGRVWARYEWLEWTTSGQHLPPSITTTPLGAAEAGAGALSTPGTVVLFPHDRVNNEFRGGFRMYLGYWFDDDRQLGVEANYFFLHNSKQGTSVRSDATNVGVPILARPFVNALTGLPDAALVSFPTVVFGSAEVRAENHASGAGVNLVYNLSSEPCGRLDGLFGWRYLGVFDRVTYHTDAANFVALNGVPAGSRVQVMDRFRTLNHFNGVGVGLSGERRFGHWFVAARASLALGGVNQILEIEGRTVTTSPGLPVRADFGGLYTQPGIIDRFDRTGFTAASEFGLRFGVQLTDLARLYAGYDWTYLGSVARAGDQIDTRVNPNFLPPRPAAVTGPQFPAFTGFHTTDYWLQGVTFGLELKF